jgi:hypothetical protein
MPLALDSMMLHTPTVIISTVKLRYCIELHPPSDLFTVKMETAAYVKALEQVHYTVQLDLEN